MPEERIGENIKEKFISGILPGNYWLTKSMEFVKIGTSGTLWYLKKWIVFYHYVFMKPTMYQQDIDEIIIIFDTYIDSLDESVRSNARDLFYAVDIKGSFVSMSNFLNTSQNFANDSAKKQFELNAKKFYFTYIMNLGGQAGYKKEVKDKIDEDNYTYENCEEFIAIKIDGKNSELERERDIEKKLKINKEITKLRSVISDYHAAYRNERQIFFYYGFFHGKYSSDLSGFYKLTNIGKFILKANFHELLLIWEHQKIKMVSQSPINEIQNLENQSGVNYEKFSILNHPYVTLLKTINARSSITCNEYQYIISKMKNSSPSFNVLLENEIGIDECSDRAKIFNRKAELGSADFQKELKKYILGVCELPKDNGTNYFKFLSWIENLTIEVLDKEKANFITDTYSLLTNYLDENNEEFYENCQNTLKTKYLAKIQSTDYTEDDTMSYTWNKYMINFDVNLYLNLIYISMSLRKNKYNYSLTAIEIKSMVDDYKTIYKMFGFKKVEFVNYLISVESKLSEHEIHKIAIKEEMEYSEITPRTLGTAVEIVKLQEISAQNTANNNIHVSIGRERNHSLIANLKSFYITNYSDEVTKLIKCDCCEERTFITRNNIPYLEFHHLIPFNQEQGPDHYLNLFGICPNCHRKLHFISNGNKKDLYDKLSAKNNLNEIIIDRINTLMDEDAIEPIHLDFLKKEQIITTEQYNELMNKDMVSA